MASKNRRLIAAALGSNRKRIYRRHIKEAQDRLVKGEIDALHLVNPAYGHKRVALALGYGKNKVLRIMRKYGIKPPRRKGKKIWLTRSVSSHHYTNLIRQLTANRPGHIFVSDLTYLPYQGHNIYLATVEDLFTREIIAAELSDRHDSRLALTTIKRATIVSSRPPEIFHTDQGSEFMAAIVTNFLEQKGVKISVSDKASPWQNGYKESFFGRFKEENGDLSRFESLGELIEEIYAYIHYYNHLRIHTSLKMSPIQFRQRFQDADIVSRKSGT